MDPVKDLSITRDTTLKELGIKFQDSGGFVAGKLGTGIKILGDMFSEKDCYRVLSFPACIIATGTRGLIKDMIKNKMFDLVITTCGTLDHDLARAWKDYYKGSFDADDEELYKKGINRLGNVFVPNESYGEIIEGKLMEILKGIYDSGKRELSTWELNREIGKRIPNENSILHWAAKNEIPVIVPGITDGSVGTQIMMFMQEHKDFRVDVFGDEEFLSGKFFGDIKAGALMIGGGISKHHVIWWAQMCGGLDYAVYITTAPEWDGSLSGARLKEAVSWGKVKEEARYTTIEGDATVLLPLLMGTFL